MNVSNITEDGKWDRGPNTAAPVLDLQYANGPLLTIFFILNGLLGIGPPIHRFSPLSCWRPDWTESWNSHFCQSNFTSSGKNAHKIRLVETGQPCFTHSNSFPLSAFPRISCWVLLILPERYSISWVSFFLFLPLPPSCWCLNQFLVFFFWIVRSSMWSHKKNGCRWVSNPRTSFQAW